MRRIAPAVASLLLAANAWAAGSVDDAIVKLVVALEQGAPLRTTAHLHLHTPIRRAYPVCRPIPDAGLRLT